MQQNNPWPMRWLRKIVKHVDLIVLLQTAFIYNITYVQNDGRSYTSYIMLEI